MAKANEKHFRSFFKKLKSRKPKDLDIIVSNLHNKAFEEIDCLDCANCCKSISPALYDKDVQRISRKLHKKPSEIVEEYLLHDGDSYYFKETPCPFLMSDNYCMIYEARPKACAEYPHTDRKKFYQLLPLTLKNRSVCPAVYQICYELESEYISRV